MSDRQVPPLAGNSDGLSLFDYVRRTRQASRKCPFRAVLFCTQCDNRPSIASRVPGRRNCPGGRYPGSPRRAPVTGRRVTYRRWFSCRLARASSREGISSDHAPVALCDACSFPCASRRDRLYGGAIPRSRLAIERSCRPAAPANARSAARFAWLRPKA